MHLLGSDALGDATNNVAEYTAVRNALRAAADAGATSAHVRMDSPVVFGHLSGASRARAEHLIKLKEEVEAQVARYPGRVTFARVPRERNGVADELVHARRWLSLPIHARLFRCEAQATPTGERDVHDGGMVGSTLPSLPPEVRVVAANGAHSAAACHPRQRLIIDTLNRRA